MALSQVPPAYPAVHVQRDARAVDHAAEHVAAEAIGAEHRLRPRPRLDQVEVLLVGRMRRQHVGAERHDDDRQRPHGAHDHHRAARNPPKPFRHRLRKVRA